MSYLNSGLPQPVVSRDGLDRPYWEGAANNKLVIQRCNNCRKFQWGPEWICHSCNSLDVGWDEVATTGIIYSYERIWHPVHPALKDQGPYIVVLVELPQADNARVIGNLLGDPEQEVHIGSSVSAVFEHHSGEPDFTLIQWQVA